MGISWLEKIVQLENINAEQKMLNFILGVFEDVADHSSFGRDDDHNGCFQLLICLLCEKLAFRGRRLNVESTLHSVELASTLVQVMITRPQDSRPSSSSSYPFPSSSYMKQGSHAGGSSGGVV